MNETGAELNFDRAEYADRPATGPRCDVCKNELAGQYWQWQQRVVCANCRGQIETALAKSRSSASFGKALLLGGATALGGGIAYAIFAQLTGWKVAFITIGIAFLVAKVIRKASGGLGGLRYQVLAVVLAYMAGTMSYLPGLINGLLSAGKSPSAHVGLIIRIMLEAPFLALSASPMGILIVGFGMWEAWRRTRGGPTVIDGPYNVALPKAAEATATG